MVLSHWLAYNYNYYDHPEGEAPFEKMFACGKYGTAAGMFMGLTDCLAFSKVHNYKAVANCMAFWVIPFTAMGVSFAAATYVSHNLRKKDDKINYAVGVAASTAVLHKWRNNFTLSVVAGVWMLGAAMIKKEVVQRDWRFFPQPVKKVVMKRREWGTNADPRYM